MWTPTAFAVTATTLLALSADAAGLYTKNSPVLQVDAQNYKRLITMSNYTSIVEFYAPWCGHCQSLKPAYEKAAKSLQGVAKVAAVNCDEEANKPLCGALGIKGFPTLKIVRPGKKAGKPVVEDYQMQRTAKAITDAVKEKIPNHVKKLTDKNVDAWFTENSGKAKAILFSDKSTSADFFKALAIDFLGNIAFAQMKESSAAAEKFGVMKAPTFLLFPWGPEEKIFYMGEYKKEAMSEFLTQIAPPNPDPAPEAPKPKKEKKNTKKASGKKKPASSKISSSDGAGNSANIELEDSSFTIESMGQPTESPSPEVDSKKPVVLDEPMVKQLNDQRDLNKACFGPKSQICVLALLPASMDKIGELSVDAVHALVSLGDLQTKYSKRHKLFPFYAVPTTNAKSKTIRDILKLRGDDDFEIIAVNAKRGWWRRYSGDGYGIGVLEDWIDAIRMNEGKREPLPESLIIDYTSKVSEEDTTGETDATKPEQVPEPATEAPPVEESTPLAEPTADTAAGEPSAAEPQPEATPEVEDNVPEPKETAITHEEL